MKNIQFDNITFGYSPKEKIFEDCSFTINYGGKDGHIVAIMGASASGKTTLLKLLLEIVKPLYGKIKFISEKPVLSYLPQEPVLFDHLTAKENANYFSRISKFQDKFDESQIRKFSKTLEMNDVLEGNTKISELSGGQLQRISLLRALSIKPNILLLDEPTTGIDADLKQQFLLQLIEVIKKQNILALYVTHHKEEVQLIADEVIYLTRNHEQKSASISLQSTIEFFSTPPTIDARKVLNFPISNILSITAIQGSIQLSQKNSKDSIFINVEANNLFFSNECGFGYKPIRSNGIFTAISLENNQTLIVKKEQINGSKVFITGNLTSYDKNGLIIGSISLNENNIVNRTETNSYY